MALITIAFLAAIFAAYKVGHAQGALDTLDMLDTLSARN